MSFFSRKKHTEAPSTLAPASGLASSQVPPNLQSQSHLKSSQKIQQPEPVCPWSAHALPFGPSLQSLSPYLRRGHSLSTTATTVSDLFLFGGYKHSSKSPSNDLYVISTRDFSTTLLQTSGDVPCPRDGHRAVLTGTSLLIWGGNTIFDTQNAQNQSYDDSFYLLNLVSREWTRIVVDGPGPGGRYYHTMDLIGSKLFVFGGWSVKRYFNDIWALDLNCLTSNPFWESYGPAPGNKKPLPRAGHVSVTTGDRIIIHGGHANKDDFNDTWSFNISTQKWTELQCTGSIPSPCGYHVAVLIDDVMYVYGGNTIGGTYLGDLTALNMSTQRWTAFQDIGPSPSARFGHAMACDGARVFVLGGRLSAGARVVEAKPIHILDTSMYFLIVVSFEEPSSLKQNSSFTRNPTPTLSSIVRRPPN
ncbi:hypothetical protein BGY98DRAFT_911333 [Russula aff. rugulosa BPL654]|nr:hypothetical protein BGY98DRAFT_911333 [Russula aff. rugulosa BPL654]